MYEYKSFEQWVREDAKGHKRTLFVASMLVAFLSGICGVVFLAVLVLTPNEQNVGALSSPIELATVVSLGLLVLSYVAHDIAETALSEEYKNYVFKKLYGTGILFG
ncbi:MAG: hypothetical protein ACD_22C00210G0002 [uncultured bacterium]|uniref:Uncharacterized protein n=1 Tax=candidate division WWE3 bacterium TaxID=2053526 RepID=A0A656PNZ1_UNCKA|nr:hypothetical protein P147_WWE3C00001G0384 [candidate division WWE3 bacterium RAAC2_WWE3_1]EKD99669.1 MAG: hypothetical protein ACD_22C00210G0002 [uncultured bacterium]KKS29731.1 MAG: hypothetical protein UU91_C0004G0123 [candidate division WWE3 bacterium GW2011_GWB1_42_117]KKS55541.1 MAG: hypothetical protein UV21_C0001G0123 [candidate division WWE3 bacterium GW2011_GWD2_42_34]KKT06026.1 MAG: hypothetical protein UV83_C0001G0344 [candidate division WWE3 bacterium GW2011_GWE2_43_18]KKT06944.